MGSFELYTCVVCVVCVVMRIRPPMTVSDTVRIRVLIRCKDGKLLRVNENLQFFYDQHGNVCTLLPIFRNQARYSIMCILDWEESESYGFDRWLSIVKVLSPRIEDVPAHPPSSQNFSPPFDDPTQRFYAAPPPQHHWRRSTNAMPRSSAPSPTTATVTVKT